MARKMPKSEERRKKHQPFAIDKLPEDRRNHIIELRAKWMTWEQIEQDTTTWKWDQFTENQRKLFPERRISHSTLHRWYAVVVRQKLQEIAAERQASLAVAERFSAAGYEKLDQSVKNAIADVVFSHAKSSADPEQFRKTLAALARLLQRDRQLDIAKQRVDVERMKVEELLKRAEKATHDAAKKLGGGGKLTIDDINRLREHTFGLPPIKRSMP